MDIKKERKLTGNKENKDIENKGVFNEDDFLRIKDNYQNVYVDPEFNEPAIRNMFFHYKGYEKDRHNAYVNFSKN